MERKSLKTTESLRHALHIGEKTKDADASWIESLSPLYQDSLATSPVIMRACLR